MLFVSGLHMDMICHQDGEIMIYDILAYVVSIGYVQRLFDWQNYWFNQVSICRVTNRVAYYKLDCVQVLHTCYKECAYLYFHK